MNQQIVNTIYDLNTHVSRKSEGADQKEAAHKPEGAIQSEELNYPEGAIQSQNLKHSEGAIPLPDREMKNTRCAKLKYQSKRYNLRSLSYTEVVT